MIRLLAAGGLVLAAVLPAAAQRSTPDPHASFLADVEKVKAHFLASQGLYAAGQAGPAGVHAGHPVHEIGERVVRPIRQAAGQEAAERARTLLKQPGRVLETKPIRVTPSSLAPRANPNFGMQPPALCAAAYTARSPDSGMLDGMVGSAHGEISSRAV